MAKIVVAVCGSVAAVRVPELVRELKRHELDVECVMSDAAAEIIHPNVLEWASGSKVITRLTGACEHVALCGVEGEAKALVICPATSNTISKIACGIDDTPVTTFAATALGSGIPVIIVPAMHISMYYNPFVVENIKNLKKQGVVFIEPEITENKAKLPGEDVIVEEVLGVLS
ncbi:MAG: flavoprotein [Candidatus Altiarchaeota archaeon]